MFESALVVEVSSEWFRQCSGCGVDVEKNFSCSCEKEGAVCLTVVVVRMEIMAVA
jgi:hypothetical protein